MSTSDVRNIESIERLRTVIVEMGDGWSRTLQEVRASIHRAEQYFAEDVPRYWRRQNELAERELSEALDELHQKQAAARAGDRASALEAQKRVALARTRIDLCRQKVRSAKSTAIEIRQACDELLGPLADMLEHSDNLLPAAAEELVPLIDHLRRYADASQLPRLPIDPPESGPAQPPG